ncbi:putative nitroreductase [Monocercomonoides exilis]|uniref:putative nitroreductase n=1 Tax=Monocercomonoides exilis TaxID=2049356 RepID=UPI003559CFC8|nr:putative nitroreductase [Monocercomonoides exilis]|eukprot:MONOS_5898.1-p1 / transcript=MONOS_5898.1 / gene=MONOS_5898 / organism=Monocercomonoides_exilis_PA203 / gene_product=nitroreductase / transcript_product=nitroreductase / location=Mono_scaffold00178:6972-7601(-) / protein_length=184 / sequence_SO=supercontig / SO=protein_coding / is_pseudo=false
MEVIELIKRRYSCRKFDPKPVPKELLLQILDAGHLSPSGMNAQSWCFYVVTNREKNLAIGKKIEEAAADKLGEMVKKSHERGCPDTVFYGAPAVIYCCTKKSGGVLKEFDLGLAVQNMLLVAERIGLATVPVALAKWYGDEIIRHDVGIAEEDDFFIALPVGYRAADSGDEPRPRKDDYFKFIE